MITSEQDQNIILRDSLRHKPDSTVLQTPSSSDTIRLSDTVRKGLISVKPAKKEIKPVDTISDGTRPAITFYDPENFILTSGPVYSNSYPFSFIKKHLTQELKTRGSIIKSLRDGEELPRQPLKEDWLIFAVLTVSVLYVFISTIYNKMFHDMKRFFLFRGIGDPLSRDIQALFNWKSTIINLVSFVNIALFLYCAADFYEFIPVVIPGILFWLIFVVITIAAVTLRHITCFITGNISGETDLFNEYIITVYHSYRYLAVIFFILVILILYTGIFAVKSLFIAGLFALSITYLIRIFRLFLIFMKKNISLFYLILYLCALEILPVLVIMKYITGLF